MTMPETVTVNNIDLNKTFENNSKTDAKAEASDDTKYVEGSITKRVKSFPQCRMLICVDIFKCFMTLCALFFWHVKKYVISLR